MQTNSNIDLIATLHYVYAGFKFLGALAALIYLLIGMGFIFGGVHTGETELFFVGGLFAVLAIIVFVIILISTALSAFAGYFIQKRKYRIFCIVVAALQCFNFPLGTALGVFAIIEMEKPEIKETFKS